MRVGTHALKAGSGTSLWIRLSQHRESERSGGGNLRGSIVRLLVATAPIERDGIDCATGDHRGGTTPRDIRERDLVQEAVVS